MRIEISAAIAIALATTAGSGLSAGEATGVVFHDRNGSGTRDADEPGLDGVLVSNGVDVAATDDQGRYALPLPEDAILFVIKPRGFRTPVDPATQLPRFHRVHKPAGSPPLKYGGVPPTGPFPSPLDFPLQPQQEPERFRAICFGDTQVRNLQEVDFLAHDIVEDLVGTDAAFGFTLGDIVFDDLSMFEPLARCIGRVGVPWYHVLGNHDEDYDAPAPHQADETHERVFGPSHYAFQYASVHFLVLRDVMWDVTAHDYHAELGAPQLRFIENYLRHVPREELIVLLMHIPLPEIADRARLFELLAPFPHTFSLSAHTHSSFHLFLGRDQGWLRDEPHHHLVQTTACGGWWSGTFDELGIPHATMGDGGPNGHSIISFDGTSYTVAFRAARRPAEHQMAVHAPESVAAAASPQVEVVVNVFAGSDRSTTEMRVGAAGQWQVMERFTGQDPFFLDAKAREKRTWLAIAQARGIAETDTDALRQLVLECMPFLGRPLPGAGNTSHLWRRRIGTALEPGYHTIAVRTTDMFGQTHTAQRLIRVE